MQKSLNVISANNLRDGLNVYFIQEGKTARWDTDIALATVYGEDTLSAALDLAQQDLARNIIVDCVVVPVDENHIPLTMRERIRASGPSIKYGPTAI